MSGLGSAGVGGIRPGPPVYSSSSDDNQHSSAFLGKSGEDGVDDSDADDGSSKEDESKNEGSDNSSCNTSTNSMTHSSTRSRILTPIYTMTSGSQLSYATQTLKRSPLTRSETN